MKPSARRAVAVDLFAGAGGFSLGLEQAGFSVAAAVEIDPIHAATHNLNFPYCSTICTDIRNLNGNQLRLASQLADVDIDVVAGGPPCQGFSLIGQRVLRDPRNELLFHFLRLVIELQPKTFALENVPGLAAGEHTQLLMELVAGFEKAGYRLAIPYAILNAANFGVPQDRRRLFLLGARRDTGIPEYPAATTATRSTSGVTKAAGALPACPTVWDGIGDLPNVDEFAELLTSDELDFEPTPTSDYARRLRLGLDPTDFSFPRRLRSQVLTGCLRSLHSQTTRDRFLATAAGTTERVSRFHRLHPEGVSSTLRAGTSTDHGAFSAPRPIHPFAARCITVREAARLHSFPDWYRFHRTIWHGFRQIGNSVPPAMARQVGFSLMSALGMTPHATDKAILLGPPELARFNMRAAAAHFGVSSRVIAPRRRTAGG